MTDQDDDIPVDEYQGDDHDDSLVGLRLVEDGVMTDEELKALEDEDE